MQVHFRLDFIMEANTMNPDQTAPLRTVSLCLTSHQQLRSCGDGPQLSSLESHPSDIKLGTPGYKASGLSTTHQGLLLGTCMVISSRNLISWFYFFITLIWIQYEPQHEISNNVVYATNKASDQPAHTPSLIRAFACCLTILGVLSYWLNIIWSF